MKNAHKLSINIEKHNPENWLRDVILGGQDGLVNVLGIVLGVSAASGSLQVIIAASLAAAFAESISMGAVAYTSTMAQKDHYDKEFARENEEIKKSPEKEKEEIRKIYQQKGFSGELLEKIVETITSNKTVWTNTMMEEELNLEKVDTTKIFRTSLIVTLAAFIGSLIPIIPFLLPNLTNPAITSLIASAVTLFTIGVYEAKTYVGTWWKNGLQMVTIGMGAALIGFLIGTLFQVNPTI